MLLPFGMLHIRSFQTLPIDTMQPLMPDHDFNRFLLSNNVASIKQRNSEDKYFQLNVARRSFECQHFRSILEAFQKRKELFVLFIHTTYQLLNVVQSVLIKDNSATCFSQVVCCLNVRIVTNRVCTCNNKTIVKLACLQTEQGG